MVLFVESITENMLSEFEYFKVVLQFLSQLYLGHVAPCFASSSLSLLLSFLLLKFEIIKRVNLFLVGLEFTEDVEFVEHCFSLC